MTFSIEALDDPPHLDLRAARPRRVQLALSALALASLLAPQAAGAAPVSIEPPGEMAAPISAGEAVSPFAMRGLQLGVSIDVFRNFPIPPDESERDAYVACGADATDLLVNLSDKQAGVVVCEWRDTLISGVALIPPRPEQTRIRIGDGFALPTFEFIRDDAGTYRLFKISLETGTVLWPDIYGPLLDKYGAGREEAVELQNGAGAIFRSVRNTWSNGVSSITADQRCKGTLNRMCITYLHTALFQTYVALRRSIKGAPVL